MKPQNALQDVLDKWSYHAQTSEEIMISYLNNGVVALSLGDRPDGYGNTTALVSGSRMTITGPAEAHMFGLASAVQNILADVDTIILSVQRDRK